MHIFIYADESGVFDPPHNKTFVFGGLILLGQKEKNDVLHRYHSVEKKIRAKGIYDANAELKASRLSNKDKNSIYRSLNPYHRFGVVVDQKRVYSRIYEHKKSKQRYLDFVFKLGVKNALNSLIQDGCVDLNNVENIYVVMDEHTTATDGRYELQEALEAELKIGTFNETWNRYFPPLFPKMNKVNFCMRDSSQDALIRAADITANHLYYAAEKAPDKLNTAIVLSQP